MNIIDTRIPDVKIIEPKVFGDERGFFFESFNQQQFEAAIGRMVNFVQDNHSKSSRGVLRGLHYQLPLTPKANWCVVLLVRYLMSRSIFAKVPPLLVSGSEFTFQPRINASSGSRKGLLMGL